ncbi:hypothetical protein AgCh_024831 [Apium graveolens]
MGEFVVNAPYVQNKSLAEEVELDTYSVSEVSSSLANELAEADRNRNAIECQNSLAQFIRQEAQEKANEISVSAEELQIVEAEKKKIRQEFECKHKQVEVRKKMDVSGRLWPETDWGNSLGCFGIKNGTKRCPFGQELDSPESGEVAGFWV